MEVKEERTVVVTYNVARNESEKLWVSLGWATDFRFHNKTCVYTHTHTHVHLYNSVSPLQELTILRPVRISTLVLLKSIPH